MTTPSNGAPMADFSQPRTLALRMGAAGLVLSVLGWITNPEQFYRSYLLGYLFWFGIALGALPLNMLQHMTGGAWGLAIRRLLEAATRTLPLMAVLFVPIVLGMHSLYSWANPEMVAADPVLRHKAPYLNPTFWLIRTALYFAIWIGLSWRLNAWSREQDRTGEAVLSRKMQTLSAPGVVFYFLAITFAAIDWVMALVPHWYSTIFGPLIAVGQVLNAFAFVVMMLALLARYEPFAPVVGPPVFHDLGKLMLAFVMLWAYFSFSQFLIIWAGNLPEEIRWYLDHSHGYWMGVGIVINLVHFFVPFALLLSRDLKRNMRALARVAGFVVLMRFLETLWMIVPLFHPAGLAIHWLDLAAPAGVGGIWLWWFFREVAAEPLLPLHDPYMQEAFEHVGH
jgi:hypothetical protein